MRSALVLALLGCTRAQAPRPAEDAAPDLASSEIADAAPDVVDAAPDVVDAAPVVLSRAYSGEATWYATDGRGTCRFLPNPNDPNVVAINKAQWPKIGCGQCLMVEGPNGSVKVRIVDVCPGCEAGGVDLGAEACAQIASRDLGRVRVRWYVVRC